MIRDEYFLFLFLKIYEIFCTIISVDQLISKVEFNSKINFPEKKNSSNLLPEVFASHPVRYYRITLIVTMEFEERKFCNIDLYVFSIYLLMFAVYIEPNIQL